MKAAIEQATEIRREQAISQAKEDSRYKCYLCPSRSYFKSKENNTYDAYCGCLSKCIGSNLSEAETIIFARPTDCPRNRKPEEQKQ